MTIVYTDAHALNPGDLDWTPLEALGHVVFYDHSLPNQLVDRLREADAVLVNKTKLTAEVLRQLTNLRYIGVTATGYDCVDLKTAQQQQIVVTNVRGYGTESVVQMTFSLLLELTLHVGLHNQAVQAGEWAKSADFCFWKTPLIELAGKTLGVVGYGDTGRRVAKVARAFGMRVLVNRLHPDPTDGIRYVDVPTLFAQSDVVTLHCPATSTNRGFVNRALLERMKPTAYLLNTSRGALLDEQDVADALNAGIIAGAGVDVITTEPPAAGNPLIGAKNCLITPHIAWATVEARQRLLTAVTENLRAFQAGKPQNVVS